MIEIVKKLFIKKEKYNIFGMKINLICMVENNLFSLRFYFLFNTNFRSKKFLL